MTSSDMISSTSSRPTIRATSRLARSRISATMWYGSAAIRVVGDREDRLDHVGVGLVALGREDDDRARRRQARDTQVVEVHRAAGAADDLRPARGTDPRPDLVLHLDLVAVGEDDDRAARLVRVGLDDLGDHGEDLLRPAEDHGVVALDHPRAALAQLGQLALEARVEDADEGADDEDAAEGDPEHREQEPGRALVAAHRPRVEGPQQAEPEEGREVEVGGDAGHPDDEGDADDQQRARSTNRPRMRAIVPRPMNSSNR